jgi:archaellum component FlaF (FlaF/FlaG flagellin family)
MKGIILVIISITALIYACEPCAECGKKLYFEPTINVKFIDKDSLDTLESEIKLINKEINNLQKQKDTLTSKIEAFEKTIDKLADSIKDGKTQYIADTIAKHNLILSYDSLKKTATRLDSTKKAIKATLDIALKNVNAGLVQVKKLTILENGRSVSNNTLYTNYAFPLLMEDFSTTTYEIELGNEINTIGFEYETELRVDAKRRIKMRAFNIDTVTAGYSYPYPPKIDCTTTNCEDNEVLVTIYF